VLTQNSLNNGARWEVIWLGKRRLVRKEYGQDFSEALRTYYLLKSHGKKVVTLRCQNVGFPTPKSVRYMQAANLKGIYWCSYCIQLRRFKTDEFKRFMYCPVCEATTRDFHIRQANPKAVSIGYGRSRRGRRSRRVRRRAR
jgi:hypothetical protein